jgi:hypothetical protein
MQQPQIMDKTRPALVIPLGNLPIELKPVFENQTTEWLYSVKEVLDKVIASRSDARR